MTVQQLAFAIQAALQLARETRGDEASDEPREMRARYADGMVYAVEVIAYNLATAKGEP